MKFKEKKTIFYFLIYVLLISISLKYFFAGPQNYSEHIIKFKGNNAYLLRIILFEIALTGIFYRYMPDKDYLIVLLFSVFITTMGLYSGVHHLQGSPTGDYRFYMAQSQKILSGHLPWEDPYYPGELTYYSYLYFTVVAIIYFLISIIFDISLGKFYIFSGVVIRAISPFVMYWAGKRLFNRHVALLAAFLTISFFDVELFGSPNWLTALLGVPALVWFYEEKYLKSGIVLGLIIYTYLPNFWVPALAIVLYHIFKLLTVRKEGVANIKVLAGTFLIALLVGLPYILPIFLKYYLLPAVYQLPPSTPASVGSATGFFYLHAPLKLHDLLNAIMYDTLYFKILLIGLAAALLRHRKNHIFLLFWFAAFFLMMGALDFFNFSALITMRTQTLIPSFILLLSVPFYEILNFLFKKIQVDRDRFLRIGFLVIIGLWVPTAVTSVSPPPLWKHWIKPDPADIMEQMDWIKENTSSDDVILSGWDYANNWLVPFTGRKVVLASSFYSPLGDYPSRASDYNQVWGPDYAVSKKLLKKYKVKYAIDRRPLKYTENVQKKLITGSGKLEPVPDQDRIDLFKQKEFKLVKRLKAGNIYEFVPDN